MGRSISAAPLQGARETQESSSPIIPDPEEGRAQPAWMHSLWNAWNPLFVLSAKSMHSSLTLWTQRLRLRYGLESFLLWRRNHFTNFYSLLFSALIDLVAPFQISLSWVCYSREASTDVRTTRKNRRVIQWRLRSGPGLHQLLDQATPINNPGSKESPRSSCPGTMG